MSRNALLAASLVLYYTVFLGYVAYISVTLFLGIYKNNFTIVTWVLNSTNPSSNIVRSIFIHAGFEHLAGNLFAFGVFLVISVVVLLWYEYSSPGLLCLTLTVAPLLIGVLADALYYLYLVDFDPTGTGTLGASGVGFALMGILAAITIDASRAGRTALVTNVHKKVEKRVFSLSNVVLTGMILLIGVSTSLPTINPHVDYAVHVFCGVSGFLVGQTFMHIEALRLGARKDMWHEEATRILFLTVVVSIVISLGVLSMIP